MPQDPNTLPVERPKAAASPTAPAAPADPADDVIETRVRERLKADFGVEDAEEIKRWRADAEEGRQYKNAWGELQRRAQLAQSIQQPQPPMQPRQGPPGQRPPDINRLREYSRIDPLGGYMEMDRFRDAQYQQRFAQIEQRAMGAVRAQQYASAEKDAESFVRDEFPEAYDARTNLHKAGYQVYHSMPELQMRGDGFRIATEIAAAREGILPKSKRRTEPTVSRSDVQAQSIERGTKRPPKDGDGKEDATLTPREKAMAARGGVDEATFKKAKAARAAGKNIRVD